MARFPFTLAFLGVMLVANALAGTMSGPLEPHILAAWGVGVDAVRDGDVARFFTAIFLSHGPAMLMRQLLFAATVIGAVEWMWGSYCAAGLFFGIDLAASATLLAVIALVPALCAFQSVNDVGMSMGGFGLIGVLIARWRLRWIALIAILGLVAVKYAVAPEPLADGGHVIALGIGFCVGLFRLGIPEPAK